MELRNRNLKQGLSGEDVALLQSELIQLHYEISDKEVSARFFGDQTFNSVRDFQKVHGLDTTGEVDGLTASVINAKLGELTAQVQKASVRGTVKYSDGTPLQGLAVTVNRTGKDSQIELGTAQSSQFGDFEVGYSYRTEDPPSLPVSITVLDDNGGTLFRNTVPETPPVTSVVILLNRPYLVRGYIRDAAGQALAGVTVSAFDKDLRSRQELGTTTSDSAGHYEIEYTADRFGRAEKDSADLTIEAYGLEGKVIAASPVLFNAKPVEEIDLSVTDSAYQGPSEYERFIKELTGLLDNVGMPDLTADDEAFLAGDTGIEARYIHQVVLSAQWANQLESIPASAFYGLLRNGLPETLQLLLGETPERQRSALKMALAKNIVPTQVGVDLDSILKEVHEAFVRQILDPGSSFAQSWIGKILTTSLTTPEQRSAFVWALRHNFDASGSINEFWDALAKDSQFPPETLEIVQDTIQLGVVTFGYAPLAEALQKSQRDGEWNSLPDLANLDKNDWIARITNSMGEGDADLPSTIPGKDIQEKIHNFASMVANAIEQRFPSVVLRSRLTKEADFEFPNKEDVLTFLTSKPDFDLTKTHIKSYFTKEGDAGLLGIKDPKGLVQQLEAMQRIAHVAPRFDQMKVLLTNGMDSSWSIARQSPDSFYDSYDELLGGQEQATQIYEAAQQKTATVGTMIVDLLPTQRQTTISVLPDAGLAADTIPDLSTLFGSLDYCACEECRSVLSPAAYLVDALEFLRYRTAEEGSVRDVLLRRRPDIGEVELTCENTNTVVPYLDLVNELLENTVAPSVSPEDWQHLPLSGVQHELFQTRLSSPELSTFPEHLNARAYAVLQDAVYPWTLPFDLSGEEIRAYLNQLGTSRAALIEAFRAPVTPSDPSAVAIAQDVLLMSPTAWRIVADVSLANLESAWGNPTEDLSQMTIFLHHTSLTYQELTELLATRFINPSPTSHVVDVVPIASCDLAEMQIIGLTDAVRGKIHRFVRLWRVLGWTMPEVDRAIAVVGDGTLDQDCLLRIASVKRVQTKLNISVSQALSLWGPLTIGDSEAMYDKVFWTPALRSQFDDSAFDPTRIPASGDGTTRISEHAAPIRAALNMTDQELAGLLPSSAGLTLENLSFLYRHNLLGRKLGLSAVDLVYLKRLVGVDPFNPATAGETLSFVEIVNVIRKSGFSVDDLRLLFEVPLDSNSPLAPSQEVVTRLFSDLRTTLHEVQSDTEVHSDPSGEQTRKWLALLSWNVSEADSLVRMLTDQENYSVTVPALPTTFRLPDELGAKITENRTGDPERLTLSCRGPLATEDRDRLLSDTVTAALSPEQRAAYESGIRDLYSQPRRFARHALAAFAYATDLDVLPTEVQIPSALADRLRYEFDTRTLWFAGAMTADEHGLLRNLSADAGYQVAIDLLLAAPDNASQPLDLVFLTEAQIQGLLDLPLPVDRFAFVLQYIEPYLERTLRISAVVQALAEPLDIAPQVLKSLLTRYVYSIDTPGQFIVDDILDLTGSAPPASSRTIKAFRLLYEVARVLGKFAVTLSELPWLFRPADDPTAAEVNLNLLAHVGDLALPAPDAFRRWSRLCPLFKLRDRLGSDVLARIFALARQTPADMVGAELSLSAQANWSTEDIHAFVSQWGLADDSFRDERPLARLSVACDFLDLVGVSALECLPWAEPAFASAGDARNVADSVRNAVRARYTTEQWPNVGKPLRDRLRERQTAALTAYLIANEPDGHGNLAWHDARDVSAYFLIDVEMSACQQTSRVKLAHSSIQLFVQRCLMNLEPRVKVDESRDRDWQQWEWMKHYRVWEANRQIFLYPENWIEPDLRNDKTEFFQAFESELLQNDLTAETAETAFLNYFDKLDDVSRLEISAMYRNPGDATTLHVFGRTRGTPHVYYHRQQLRTDFQSCWTPWEKVNVDIEGDHLIPVVWNGRLYLFWPSLLDQTDQGRFTMPGQGTAVPEPNKYTKLQIAWSEHRNGKWTPKTISKEFARIPVASQSDLYFKAVPADAKDLEIHAYIRSLTSEMRSYVTRFEDLTAQEAVAQNNLNEAAQHWDDDPAAFAAANQALGDVQRQENTLGHRVQPTIIRCGFRLSGSDGSVRRLPLGSADFIPMARGTYLAGMSFVEAVWEWNQVSSQLVQEYPNVAVPINTPDGLSDRGQDNAWWNTLQVRPEWTYTLIDARDCRRGPSSLIGDGLWLNVPFFHSQRILQQLPQPTSEESSNVFRVLLPYSQLTSTAEFFYQDDNRAFFSEMTCDPEVLRQYRDTLATVPQDGLGSIFLDLLLAMGPAGSQKYQFHPHYHPYPRMLMQRLIQSGTDGLLQRQVQVAPVDLSTPAVPFDFEAAYGPNPAYVRDYPIEEMDFSPDGAYSQYNWELFFHAPLLIADKLSKNQRFAEAQHWFHTIFDPTDMSNEESPQRYWRTRPFFETSHETYQQERIERLLLRLASGADDGSVSNQVAQWRNNPFDPHLVARTRTTAFQRTVVMKYLDNLIAWGDQLFRQESLESINEAMQLYVLAAEILGRSPQRVDRQIATPAQTYYQLLPHLDSFSNALVQFENLVPPPQINRPMGESVADGTSPRLGDEPRVSSTQPATPKPPLQLPLGLYFCILPNAKLLQYWDTVADRLFKIRHCLNIDGIFIQPLLFDLPIDPGLLVRARALGVDLRSVLSDLGAPLSQYRFLVILQKASELCAEVRGFGAALLSALEKRDGEALARMRSGHELSILDQMQQIREQQLEDAKCGLDALQKSSEAISLRRDHYAKLAKEFMKPGERSHLSLMEDSLDLQMAAAGLELTANIIHLIPNAKAGVPTSIGVTFGGDNLGKALEAFAKYSGSQASMKGTSAAMSATHAGYDRRAEEWGLQVDLADKELQQIDQQIAGAKIRVAIAEQEVRIHDSHMQQAREVDTFMRGRFTNLELYDWMSRQLADVYFQCYQQAYDMAKRAERSFHFERGDDTSNFIQYGYWDSLHKGLLAGERLQFDLRRLELAYIEQNRRDYELTKHISLALLDPFALHQLRTTGGCFVSLPESLFDHDHPGHYMRRIKSVSLTLPAVVGPYTSVNCRLTLQSSFVRVDPEAGGASGYLPDQDMVSDSRFRSDFGSMQSIATSRGNSDAGLFEVNFRDERYLPFEGAGVISTWQLDLDPRCNDFDLETLSDVVMELRYTARDGGQQLRAACLSEVFPPAPGAMQGRLFSARTDFADAWNAFLYPIDTRPDQTLALELSANRFPFRAQQGQILLTELHVVLMLSEEGARNYPRPTGGIGVIIRKPGGDQVTAGPSGLLLSVGGDLRVGSVPGGAQSLSPAVTVNSAGGANRWQLTVPQAVIDGLPVGLRAQSVTGRTERLAPGVFEDLLLFGVYEII